MTTTALTAPAPITAGYPEWLRLKAAATALQALQVQDGSVPDAADHEAAAGARPHHHRRDRRPSHRPSRTTPTTWPLLVTDFDRWADGGFGVPDFLDSLLAFQPQQHRVDGLQHLVVFPMYTQNGSPDRLVEAVLIEVIWPEFIADLEAGDYSNKLFVPIRFVDFTPGYDTNSAVLFPETVAVRETPTFTWGAIFADREAARFRRVAARRRRDHLAASCPTDAAAAARRPAADARRPSSCGT